MSCVKLTNCPDHPRRHRPLKLCMRCRVREVVIYFKFDENQSMGLGAVGGRTLPSPIDFAHSIYNSLYYRTSRNNDSNTISYIFVIQRKRQQQKTPVLYSVNNSTWKFRCTVDIDKWQFFLHKILWRISMHN